VRPFRERSRVSSGETHVSHDGSKRLRIADEGHDAHLGAAPPAAQRIHREDPLQKLGPPLSEHPKRRPVRHPLPRHSREFAWRARVDQNTGVSPAGAQVHRVGAVFTN